MKNIIVLLFSLLPLACLASRMVASVSPDIRAGHARELMGPGYHRSVVSKAEKKTNFEENILSVVLKRLPKAHKGKAHLIANTIIEEAEAHALDPYFVMAVISGESSFNPLAVGPVGEIGLMQIRLTTGEWMARMEKMKWDGEKTLRDPVQNIKLGTAYIAWLRTKFEGHGQLYLAAYNMGARSVKKALGRKIWPKDYPMHVMKRYVAFYRDINVNL